MCDIQIFGQRGRRNKWNSDHHFGGTGFGEMNSMKAVPGLIVALILGGAAVVFNWIYLEKKASEFQVVSFLGIRDDAKIRLGETLLETHFEEVPVPKTICRATQEIRLLYRDKATVAGIKATRDYEGGDLVHREDYRTPAKAIKLRDDERLIWVTVESRAFVPALVNPGDQLTFVFPQPGTGSGPRSAESIGGNARTLHHRCLGDAIGRCRCLPRVQFRAGGGTAGGHCRQSRRWETRSEGTAAAGIDDRRQSERRRGSASPEETGLDARAHAAIVALIEAAC